MAISQVRAQLNGTWYTLTYNSATGKYEATITPSAVSSNETGGYFPVTVEAKASDGTTATLSGTTYPGLRLVVEDKTAPTLTVTAPANGLVTAAGSVTVSGTVSDAVGVAWVKINGTAVTVTNGSFSGTVALSGGSNTITVTASDPSGNVATVTRTVTRATAGPTLAVTSPEDGSYTNQGTVTVTGTVSDSVSPVAGVTVNGQAATISGGTFTATVSLQEGDNTITVVASNQVGLTTTTTLSVTRDTAAPVIALTSPTAGQITGDASFTVTGTVSDSLSGVQTVTVNGQAATVTGGTFTADVTLTEGVNTITATVTDQAGNTATATGSVVLDTIPPELTVTNPAGDLITNNPDLTVTGMASDSGSGLEKVTVNGQEAPVSGGAYSLAITLQEGDNTVTVTATDRVGNETTVTRSVLLDTQKPVLTLVSPPEGWIDNNQPTVVFSAVDEPGGSGVDLDTVEVTVDGVTQTSGVTVSGGTISFTPAAPLSDGQHVITVTVMDRAGNERGLSVTYGIDTMPPELYLKTPNEHRVVDVEFVTVSGIAFDSGSGVAEVTAAGKSAVPDTDGRFSLEIPLTIGENQFAVTARDRAGMETSENIYMIRLVTDRTAADVAFLQELYNKYPTFDDWPEATRAWFLQTACLRGAYDPSDWNRVGIAVRYLAGELDRRGYLANVQPKTDWTEQDAPTVTPMRTYVNNVKTIRDAQNLWFLTNLPLPYTLSKSTVQDWNNLEKAMVEADAVFPRYTSWTSGEISCGEG